MIRVEQEGGIKGFGNDSGGLGGRTVASGHDSCGLGKTVVSGRDLRRLRRTVVSGRDLSRAEGVIEGFGYVGAFVGYGTCFLAHILGSNGCNAFLFLDLVVLARHVSQVARTLLLRLEASLRNKESRRF
jgi:hypothetical protein